MTEGELLPTHYVLDEHGAPTPEPNLQRWCSWINVAVQADRVRVAFSRINGALVSTVFLGLRRPGGIFMTIVVGGPLHGHGCYYETRAEAERGHALTVERVRAAPDDGHVGKRPELEWVVMFHHNLLDLLGIQ